MEQNNAVPEQLAEERNEVTDIERIAREAHRVYGRDTIPVDVVAETALNMLRAACNCFEGTESEEDRQRAALMVVAADTVFGIVKERIEAFPASEENEHDRRD